MVGKVSEPEPNLAKLCEAQGRGENVLERNDSNCQKPKMVLRLAIGPWGVEKGQDAHGVGEVGAVRSDRAVWAMGWGVGLVLGWTGGGDE